MPPATSSSTAKGAQPSQGIPNDSTAVVVAMDIRNNQLTVRTSHGDEVIYSPHLTTAMTTQSKVYREENQEFALGRPSTNDPTQRSRRASRKGDFGTIAAIGDKLEVRLDKGESVQLTQEQAKHIEHGYAVDSLKTGAPNRILISQEGSFQTTSETASFSRTGREVIVYTSDGSSQVNAVAPAIAIRDPLKPAIPLSVQQQSEAPSNALLTPEQAPSHPAPPQSWTLTLKDSDHAFPVPRPRPCHRFPCLRPVLPAPAFYAPNSKAMREALVADYPTYQGRE